MEIKILINKPVSSNCYLITENEHVIVIDPGTNDCIDLLTDIDSAQLTVDYILLTHEHFDHCAGVNKLRNKTNAPLCCTAQCNALIQHTRGNYSAYWTEGKPFVVEAAEKIISDGDTLCWQGHEIYFYTAPGHSSGSMAVRIDKTALFTGDNYIPNIRTYTNLNGGSKKILIRTLARFYLFNKYESIVVYPGHLKPLPINKAHFNESVRGYSLFQMQQEAERLKENIDKNNPVPNYIL